MTTDRQPSPDASASLKHRTTSGYAYMLLKTAGDQVVNLAGFIILGWLLFKDDFGLFALTNTLAIATGLVSKVGLRVILINRHRHYRRWANPAFWMALALGILGMLIMGALAPFAPAIFKSDPQLTWLCLILALHIPFTSISIVPEAAVQARMQFRLLAVIRFSIQSGIMILTIVFAAVGLGAFSFVLPRPIMAAVRFIVLWRAARPPIRIRPQLRRWRFMLRDSAMLATSNASNFVTTQCDYLILGLFHTDAVVGVYFYAYALSQRAVVMLTVSLRDVLFPALSSIEEPSRRVAAFLRASRLLATVGTPFCLLQVVLAGPVFRSILPERWIDGIPILQALSVGTIFRLVGQPALSLINAQERFRMLVAISIAGGIAYIAFCALGAIVGAGVSVAIAVSIHMALAGVVQVWCAIRVEPGAGRRVLGVFVFPVVAGTVMTAVLFAATSWMPHEPWADWTQIVVGPMVGLAIYAALIRLGSRAEWDELTSITRRLLKRRNPAAS